MADASFLLFIFPAIFGFILGACFGSFASALVWRIPRKIPWIYETDNEGNKKPVRSKCTSCNRILTGKDLIPIFSWVFQGGKCRSCQTKISAIYPVLEIICGLSGAMFFIYQGISVYSFISLLWIVFFIIQTWIFVTHRYWSRDVLIILLFLSFLLIMFTGF